jgi:hypothetical protein
MQPRASAVGSEYASPSVASIRAKYSSAQVGNLVVDREVDSASGDADGHVVEAEVVEDGLDRLAPIGCRRKVQVLKTPCRRSRA